MNLPSSTNNAKSPVASGLRLGSWDGTPLNARARLTNRLCSGERSDNLSLSWLPETGSARIDSDRPAEIPQHLQWHHKGSLLRAARRSLRPVQTVL